MSYQDWLPTSWLHHKDTDGAPLVSLRKQVDSLFDDFDRGFWTRSTEFDVRSNISETDEDICITAELPGLTEEDVDVSLIGNRLTIKGEKKSETEEKNGDDGRQYHRIERRSGAYQRSNELPVDNETDALAAE